MINKEQFYERLDFVIRKKKLEFQAEGLGFQNFAWLGSNPSYAPDLIMLIFVRRSNYC